MTREAEAVSIAMEMTGVPKGDRAILVVAREVPRDEEAAHGRKFETGDCGVDEAHGHVSDVRDRFEAGFG